jgi:hypothetical protein
VHIEMNRLAQGAELHFQVTTVHSVRSTEHDDLQPCVHPRGISISVLVAVKCCKISSVQSFIVTVSAEAFSVARAENPSGGAHRPKRGEGQKNQSYLPRPLFVKKQ